MPLLSQERLPLQFRTAQLPPDITPFVLAKDEVAFVGEAVAVVIAETRYLAEDAAALVAVDYEPLPAVSDCRAGAGAGRAACASRPQDSNVMTEFRQSYGDVAAAFARAPHRVERQPQAASRRRAFDRRARRARRLRRQRGSPDAVDLDAARPRGARVS